VACGARVDDGDMRISRSALAALVLALAGLTACGEDGPERASEGTTTTSTTTTRPVTTTTTTATTLEPHRDETCYGGRSSPSTFDAEGGRYAVILTSLDVGARTIGFDVFQYLVGDDAIAAYHEDFPEDPEGPPNDQYSVNENPLVRSASVDRAVVVRLVRLQEDGNADLDPGTFEELPAYLDDYQSDELPGLSYNPYWLTFEDGAVTEICEQYVP
jgi:hypothetical protein